MRRRIAELENELAALDSADGQAEPEQPSGPVPESTDIYTSVSRLRVTMAMREMRTKRQQLDELIVREKALAQELHVRPTKPGVPVEAGNVSAAAASSNGAEAPEARVAPPRPVQRRSADVGGVRVRRKRRRSLLPERETKFQAASLNMFNLVISIVAVLAVLVLGILLSGVLEIDPNKTSGPAADVARFLQGVVGPILPRGR